ncbi:MAG: hypothetical protein WC443_11515, partial [Desulfobaccales bacterium]
MIIVLITAGFLLPAPTPAAASGEDVFWASMGLFSVLGATAIGYAVWEKSRPDEPRLLDGEFYGGAYLGASFAPNQNLDYNNGAVFNNGVNIARVGKFSVSNNKFDTGVVGGVKLGYFFKGCPYLGIEGESNVSPNAVSRQTVQVSPAVLGSTQATMPQTSWINWTTALHLVGRYGFLKD